MSLRDDLGGLDGLRADELVEQLRPRLLALRGHWAQVAAASDVQRTTIQRFALGESSRLSAENLERLRKYFENPHVFRWGQAAFKRRAYHQAGHAYMCYRFGIDIPRIEVHHYKEPIAEAWMGPCEHLRAAAMTADRCLLDHDLQRYVMVALAGSAAATAASLEQGGRGASSDVERAKKACGLIAKTKLERRRLFLWLYSRTLSELRNVEALAAVDKIATALMQRKQLTSAEVRATLSS